MVLSKQHYKAIADIIGKSLTEKELMQNLCSYFKSDNDRFDKTRFEKAVQQARESEISTRLYETAHDIRR